MSPTAEIAEWMAQNGFAVPPVAPVNGRGEQALILAARHGRPDVLAYLLESGANLAVLDAYGNNALWAACFAESAECIALLLQAGIAIDYQNPSGSSVLIYAASAGKHAVVAQLLDAGANPRLTTDDDFSALDLAANRQCLQLLRKRSES
ncbi:ankyrin repeat domain-containing protein [Methylomonas sp. UP202]|uniref:ankyrin repeat domain-containing protein n=1 Tax=Methylomonas sp. UP202 TaxID=3040943 RepID=UPI0024799C20|nr:ankyrin repeat domain-containing protein [Methylomonas sp. UP202]WGS85550.1 ankyrin repeat domain-containing protein [Methylomonas sp. UP202]